jgi:hypothetical protein
VDTGDWAYGADERFSEADVSEVDAAGENAKGFWGCGLDYMKVINQIGSRNS